MQRTRTAAWRGRTSCVATVHFEVQERTSLEADCTAAQMARLQGNVADRQWAARCLEVDLVNEGGWTIAGVRERAFVADKGARP